MSSDRNQMSREDKNTFALTQRELAEYYARQDEKAAQADAEAELEAEALAEALEAEEARKNAATEEQEQQN